MVENILICTAFESWSSHRALSWKNTFISLSLSVVVKVYWWGCTVLCWLSSLFWFCIELQDGSINRLGCICSQRDSQVVYMVLLASFSRFVPIFACLCHAPPPNKKKGQVCLHFMCTAVSTTTSLKHNSQNMPTSGFSFIGDTSYWFLMSSPGFNIRGSRLLFCIYLFGHPLILYISCVPCSLPVESTV